MYACAVSLLQPHSRGEITLNSTDPYDSPLINPNYYQDERDLRDIVEGEHIYHTQFSEHGYVLEVGYYV